MTSPKVRAARSRLPRSALLAALSVTVVLLSTLGVLPTASQFVPPSDQSVRAGGAMGAAAASLLKGGGPARGNPVVCAPGAPGSGVTCTLNRALAPATPRVSNPGLFWAGLAVNAAPSPRFGFEMVDDLSDGYILLFGGGLTPSTGGDIPYNDTWTFSEGAWTNITGELSRAPSPRSDAGIAYDDADGYVVLFGGMTGYNAGMPQNDTWKYHDLQWTNISTSRSPAPRGTLAMTYDAADGYVLLFGGCARLDCSVAVFNDTWTFHAGVWTPLPGSVTEPPGRGSSWLTYDPADNYVLLFGGRDAGSTRFADTWTFAGGRWTQRSPSLSPSNRLWDSMAFDPSMGKVVLYGGDFFGNFMNDTWTYGAGNWTDLTQLLPGGPPSLGDAGMVYVAGWNAVLLFGGQSFFPETSGETWLLLSSSAPPLPSTFQVTLQTQPAACGPVELGSSGGILTGGMDLLANGTYLIDAPACAGHLFSHWQTQGALSIPSTETDSSSAGLTVLGAGGLTANYSVGVAGSNSTSTPFFTTTTLAWLGLGIGAGLLVGAGLTLLLLHSRSTRPPRGSA
jgi:hypothetical protein